MGQSSLLPTPLETEGAKDVAASLAKLPKVVEATDLAKLLGIDDAQLLHDVCCSAVGVASQPLKAQQLLAASLLLAQRQSSAEYGRLICNGLQQDGQIPGIKLVHLLRLLITKVAYDSEMPANEHVQAIEQTTLCLARFFNNDLTSNNHQTIQIDSLSCTNSLDQLRHAIARGFSSVFAPLFNDPQLQVAQPSLMDNSMRALLTMILALVPGIPRVNACNFINLYDGASAGFSLRSLEKKVVKWDAPSVLLVSGKRLSRKSRQCNRQYLLFAEQLPPPKGVQDAIPGQLKGDTLVFAVLVTCPWKRLEKYTFGDDRTTMLILSPAVEICTATKLTMPLSFSTSHGIGVGNDISSNSLQYIVGDTSLTIEPNLEFAVWRHLTTLSGCFTRGQNFLHADYEERISIRNLQVWGIGSGQQLIEQQRHWEWENQQANARQSVNVGALGDDRAFLEMAGLIGNHSQGGLV